MDSFTRLRGRWMEWQSQRLGRAIPAIATFHPAYLLRQPIAKREAWRDLVALKVKLIELGAAPVTG
mgnify:FL=1